MKPGTDGGVTFNWSAEQWLDAIAQVAEIVLAASIGWETRRPTPEKSPKEIRSIFRDDLPQRGASLEQLSDALRSLIPLSGFNGHPRWFGYITSSPDPVGVLADFVASALNQNTNLWRIAPAATSVELQTLAWMKQIVGFPSESEGIFTSGGQLANFVAHAVVRTNYLGEAVRSSGVCDRNRKLRFYVSNQAHYCHSQALDLLGLGSESLALVPVDSHYRMDLRALCDMVEHDRSSGALPCCVIATAGTVGFGAIDPIRELRDFTKKNGIWMHVDGAYGAAMALLDSAPDDIQAIALADSVAIDPHKWFYSPIDAAVTLIRRAGRLRETFGTKVSYLDQNALEDDCVDLVDLTPENSRPFRALKVWLGFKAHGATGYRKSIEHDLCMARLMASCIDNEPHLRLEAPVATSVVCWSFVPPERVLDDAALDDIQLRIINTIESRGIAVLSKAVAQSGRIVMRACLVNFRTSEEDVVETVKATARIGCELIGDTVNGEV